MDDILLDNPSDQEEESSASSDEDEDYMKDGGRHKKLLSSLGVQEKSERLNSGKGQRSEATTDVSVYSLGGAKKSKVKAHQLIKGLKESVNINLLKKKLLKVEESQKHLKPSLPRVQAEQLERQVAYETTSEKVSRWEDIVQRNRRAEHLSFPLNQESLSVNTVDDYVKKFKPKTPLEEQIYGLLTGNKYVEREGKDLSLAEEEALKAMSIEEAKMRRAELQKHRALLSYHEAKSRRIKKIKSRRHLRIIRKQKEKFAHAEDDNNNEDLDDKIKLADKMRAEERAGLRHRQGSKWAKRRMAMGRYNEMTMVQIDEQRKLHGKLTHKDVKPVDEEEGGASETGNKSRMATTIPPNKFLGLPKNNPWLRVESDDATSKGKAENAPDHGQDIQNLQKKRTRGKKLLLGLETITVDQGEDAEDDGVVDEMEEELQEIKERKKLRQSLYNEEESVVQKHGGLEEEEENGDGKRVNVSSIAKFKAAFASIRRDIPVPQKSKPIPNDIEAIEPETVEPVDNGLEVDTNRRRTLSDLNKLLQMEDDITTLSEFHRSLSETPKNEENKEKNEQLTYIDPKKVFTLPSKTVSSVLPKIVEDENDENLEEYDNRMTIQEAFADDDVLEDFLSEKNKNIEDSAPKPEDLTLPGWGEWGGLGVQPSRRKKKKFFIEPKPTPLRKDHHLGHVIINEKRDVHITKHQVKQIPFPFTSGKQFERSVRQPIGSTWNTPSVVKKLTQPKVKTTIGAIIKPMDEEEAFDKAKSIRKRTISQGDDDKPGFKSHFKRKRGNKKHKKQRK